MIFMLNCAAGRIYKGQGLNADKIFHGERGRMRNPGCEMNRYIMRLCVIMLAWLPAYLLFRLLWKKGVQ